MPNYVYEASTLRPGEKQCSAPPRTPDKSLQASKGTLSRTHTRSETQQHTNCRDIAVCLRYNEAKAAVEATEAEIAELRVAAGGADLTADAAAAERKQEELRRQENQASALQGELGGLDKARSDVLLLICLNWHGALRHAGLLWRARAHSCVHTIIIAWSAWSSAQGAVQCACLHHAHVQCTSTGGLAHNTNLHLREHETCVGTCGQIFRSTAILAAAADGHKGGAGAGAVPGGGHGAAGAAGGAQDA